AYATKGNFQANLTNRFPHKRVAFGIAGANNAHDNLWAMFDAALEWMLRDDDDAVQVFYMSNLDPDVDTDNAHLNMWDGTDPDGILSRLLSKKPGGPATDIILGENTTTSPYDVLLGQWVSGPAQSSGYIPANTPWQFCMARYTIDEGAQLHWAIGAWVADSDGEFKHQVLDNYFTTTSEWPLVADVSGIAASTQFLAQALPLGDTPIEPGDRLVVELGYRALNTTSTPKYGAIVYGGSGGEDLEHGDSGEDVLEKPSWIDVPVSDGLTFSDP